MTLSHGFSLNFKAKPITKSTQKNHFPMISFNNENIISFIFFSSFPTHQHKINYRIKKRIKEEKKIYENLLSRKTT